MDYARLSVGEDEHPRGGEEERCEGEGIRVGIIDQAAWRGLNQSAARSCRIFSRWDIGLWSHTTDWV